MRTQVPSCVRSRVRGRVWGLWSARALMHRCAGYAGEADRDELEKELYQCLSAKTALILPFHWGDNQKSITQWIDRLLKRTIIGTDAAANSS